MVSERRDMGKQAMLEYFKAYGALHVHDNNPRRPHVCLPDGRHSEGYFNPAPIYQKPRVLSEICDQLLRIMRLKHGHRIEAVYGSAVGSIPLAYEAARQLLCDFGFTEKQGSGVVVGRCQLPSRGWTLVVKNVLRTGATTRKTILALEAQGAQVHPVIAFMVNCSGQQELSLPGGPPVKVVSLVDFPLRTFEETLCPLCKLGSQAVTPEDNWKELIGIHRV